MSEPLFEIMEPKGTLDTGLRSHSNSLATGRFEEEL